MSDILNITERVKGILQRGESHYAEFKTAFEGRPDNKEPRLTKKICEDIGEALVAFANADGGDLLIGVENDHTITGVPHDDTEIEKLLAAPKTHIYPGSILPLSAALKLNIDNKTLLFFAVQKATTQVYQLPDGRCVRRKDKETVPALAEQIQFDRQEIRSREYDREFVDGASILDLDVGLIQSIADNYIPGQSVELYLQQVGLVEYGQGGLHLRMAALILFAKDIQRWHPRSQIRILKVEGTSLKSAEHYNVTSDETTRGNVFQLIQNSWEQLRPALVYKTEFGSDAKFEQKFIYPEWACREALINAIAHRDYSIQNGIDVFIYSDRMEIKSPGPLLSTLTIAGLEQLEGAHESRNVLIARVLRESKYIRELGEGMKRIFELMQIQELDKPKLYSNKTWFSVTLLNKSIFTPQQAKWLQSFSNFDLTPHQKRILVLGMNNREIAPADIYKVINTDDQKVYNDEVSPLRRKKILIRLFSEPPRERAKKLGMSRESIPQFRVQIPKSIDHNDDDVSFERCLFVKNLPVVTEQELKEILEARVKVQRVKLWLDERVSNRRAFAYVWFHSKEEAEQAIGIFNGHKIKGRPMSVEKRKPKSLNNTVKSKGDF